MFGSGSYPFWRLWQRQSPSTYLRNSNLSVIIIKRSHPESGKHIRYRRGASGVRNMRAVLKKAPWCTEGVILRLSVQKTGFWCTEGVILRLSVQKTGFWCTEWKFGAQNSPLVYAFQRQAAAAAELRTSQKIGTWCPQQPPQPLRAQKNRPSAQAESRFWCLAAKGRFE